MKKLLNFFECFFLPLKYLYKKNIIINIKIFYNY